MQEGRPDKDETPVFHPVSQTRYQLERLVTMFAVVVAILLIGQLGPRRFGFACVLIVVQTVSTLYVHRSPTLRSNELGVFLSFDLVMANSAPFFLEHAWAPAVVITMYSLGANAPRLAKAWVSGLAGGSILAFGVSGWILGAPGALPLTVISFVLAGHLALRRSSDLLLAETVVSQMQELQADASAAAEQAHWLASHDPLTGLGNRRVLTDLIDEAKRSEATAGLILLDLDAFKAINDEYGHYYGDLILLDVAERLVTTLRESRSGEADAVAVRLGGDEFAVFLTDVSAHEAEAIAERVHHAFAPDAEFDGVSIAIRASLGAAVAEGRDLDDLLRQADTAMYKAKRSGGGVLRAVAATSSLGD